MARYIVRAKGAAGPVEFHKRLTIEQALEKARELRDADFTHITIFNTLTRVEITDVEALLQVQDDCRDPGGSRSSALDATEHARGMKPLTMGRAGSPKW